MRRKIFIIVLICASCLLTATGNTQDYTSLYSRSDLREAHNTYIRNLKGIWEEDLKGRLTAKQYQAAYEVKLQVPLVGLHRHPLDFYADPKQRIVTFPVLSVKFFDDICTAMAWMEKRGCNILIVSDYVGWIRYQQPSQSGLQTFPPPLKAMRVPKHALDDPYVYDVSGKALKSGIYFLMAHELAHVLYNHKNYSDLTAQEAQGQEIEADNFALNLMRRISVPPMGMSIFFTIASRFESAPGDFKSAADYEAYVRTRSTHPLSSARLINIASYIRDNVDDFTRGQQEPSFWRPRILAVADDIEKIGRTLDDKGIRDLQRLRSLEVTSKDIENACTK